MNTAAATQGLKGSKRIVLEELEQILAAGGQPSVFSLSLRTNYCHTTVWRALTDLREIGLIDVKQETRGAPATYSIRGGHR